MTPPGGTSGINGSNYFWWWWDCSKHIRSRGSVIRPLIAAVLQGRVKKPSERVWSAKHMVTMEWENQGSSGRNKLLKWQSREIRWEWFQFYTSLKHGKLCLKILEVGFIFPQGSNKRKTMLGISLHAPSMMTQFEVHGPQEYFHSPK